MTAAHQRAKNMLSGLISRRTATGALYCEAARFIKYIDFSTIFLPRSAQRPLLFSYHVACLYAFER